VERDAPVSALLRKGLRWLYRQVQESRPNSWEAFSAYVRLHPSVIVDPVAFVRIFNTPTPSRLCLEIGEGSHIFSMFNLVRPQAKITVGKRCQLGYSQFISAESIDVGDDVIMAAGVSIYDSDNHSEFWDERQFDVERCRKDYVDTKGADIARTHDWDKVRIAPVKIGDKVWIGYGVIILKGVTVGEGAIIGAGSVVTSDVKPWHIVAGNPCRHIRPISQSRKGENGEETAARLHHR